MKTVSEAEYDAIVDEAAATFRRWRTDKQPEACTFDQFEAAAPYELVQVFTAGK